METLKTSAAAKTAAFLLVVISLVLSIAGFVGMVMMDTIGGYQMSKEEMLKKGYEEMCGKYSVMALAAYKDQYDAKELAQTNFRYGIVKAKDIRSVDFSNSRQRRQSYILTYMILPKTRSLSFLAGIF